jgi:ribonuclease PH
MRQQRQPQELRDIHITPGYNMHAEGSALVTWGNTKVLATLTIENKLPPHLRGKGNQSGWLTAEYALLPRSTHERSQREKLYTGGRSQEIQRFIGRALRAGVDLSLFNGKTLTVDVDVLQADGGTRCAGILAGYAALHHAANKMIMNGSLDEWPLTHDFAAVSVGVVKGQQLVDLEYSEDMQADVDLNVVATADGKVIEVQGGGEESPIDAEVYVQLIATGIAAVGRVLNTAKAQLA